MQNQHSSDSIQYYRTPGLVTGLAKHGGFVNWLTDDIRAIVQVVQGLIVHDLWVRYYGIELNPHQVCDTDIVYMEDLFDKALSLDGISLAIPRSPEKRVIACCREFATLFCAILRNKGIPARCRCGFATYFSSQEEYEDHWICEYWNGERWVRVDPQIDPFQQSCLEKTMNPLDLSEGDFLVAGEAWKRCRTGAVDPERFGIGCNPQDFGVETLHGLWFVRGNLIRDFAALRKIETVPFLDRVCRHLDWKAWRLVAANDEDLSLDDWALLDRIGELTLDVDKFFAEIQRTYQVYHDLQVPEAIVQRGGRK